jgi:hypothetical protein
MVGPVVVAAKLAVNGRISAPAMMTIVVVATKSRQRELRRGGIEVGVTSGTQRVPSQNVNVLLHSATRLTRRESRGFATPPHDGCAFSWRTASMGRECHWFDRAAWGRVEKACDGLASPYVEAPNVPMARLFLKADTEVPERLQTPT